MSAHAKFKIETGIPVFFADPQSPWQRGTHENWHSALDYCCPIDYERHHTTTNTAL